MVSLLLLRSSSSGVPIAAVAVRRLGVRTVRQSNDPVLGCRYLSTAATSSTSSRINEDNKIENYDKTKIKNPSLIKSYLDLAKARLSALVVTTTGVGFFAGSASGSEVDPTLLASCLVGTYLCSSCAAGWNQIVEVHRDQNMKRTQQRPLVQYANATKHNHETTNLMSVNHAKVVATSWGMSGLGLLYIGTDAITTILGASNIALYSGLYTWMKPRSVYNTWVGAIVGAIPPVMGYTATTAATATAATAATTLSSIPLLLLNPEVLYLAGTLYYWQMPHFFALSFMHRIDYQRGGFQMVPVVELQQQQQQQQLDSDTSNNDYDKTANIIMRNIVGLSSMPVLASYAGLIHGSTTMFLLETCALNGYFFYKGQQFYYNRTNQNARKLFLTSLWYLPSVFMIYLLHAKLWIEQEEEETIGNKNNAILQKLRSFGKQMCIHEKAVDTAAHTTITNMSNTKKQQENTTVIVGETACPIKLGQRKLSTGSHNLQEMMEKQQQQQQEGKQIVLNSRE